MTRHSFDSYYLFLEFFMQQEYLFKKCTFGNDGIHLEWIFGKLGLAEIGINNSVDCFFFQSALSLSLIHI